MVSTPGIQHEVCSLATYFWRVTLWYWVQAALIFWWVVQLWSLKNYLLFKFMKLNLLFFSLFFHVQQANNYAWLYISFSSSVLNAKCSQWLRDAEFFTVCSMMHTSNRFSWSLFLMLCSLSINSWALKCLTKTANLPIFILHCSYLWASPFSS